ncbi:CBS domain-containing protein [Nitrospira lenta]|uniref:CBS domain-containing protein n=1 Tax=Nitrospira lenta TaxID=1436998 RepID=A0A330L871_9BACT|nr:CBS domain-containing protein [Nitrospira lenta]SPP66071.1 conserved hypothetical protein [Nitrospira lenta]
MPTNPTASKPGLPGVPAGGLQKIGQIRGTNSLVFRIGHNAMDAALELVSSHTPGAPVVNERTEFVGFVSEIDVLHALEAGKNLSTLNIEHIMAHDPIAVTTDTTIKEAVKLMEEKRLLNLPVTNQGKVAYSVTRHDLLRAVIGLGTTGED